MVVPLLTADLEVVVPDLRGLGESDKHLEPPAKAYSAVAQARSVVGLIDELGLDAPVIGRLRHRQPDRAGDRPRHAGEGARARGLAAAARRRQRILAPRRCASSGTRASTSSALIEQILDGDPVAVRAYLGALLEPLVGPGLHAHRRPPRPPRRPLRRAGRDDRLDRLVPRGLRG